MCVTRQPQSAMPGIPLSRKVCPTYRPTTCLCMRVQTSAFTMGPECPLNTLTMLTVEPSHVPADSSAAQPTCQHTGRMQEFQTAINYPPHLSHLNALRCTAPSPTTSSCTVSCMHEHGSCTQSSTRASIKHLGIHAGWCGQHRHEPRAQPSPLRPPQTRQLPSMIMAGPQADMHSPTINNAFMTRYTRGAGCSHPPTPGLRPPCCMWLGVLAILPTGLLLRDAGSLGCTCISRREPQCCMRHAGQLWPENPG